MMTGLPPLKPASVRNVYGGYNASYPSNAGRQGRHNHCRGQRFYTLGGLYNEAELSGISGTDRGAPKRIQLAYSKGNAYSWRAAPWNSAVLIRRTYLCLLASSTTAPATPERPMTRVICWALPTRPIRTKRKARSHAEQLGSGKQPTAATEQAAARKQPDTDATDITR